VSTRPDAPQIVGVIAIRLATICASQDFVKVSVETVWGAVDRALSNLDEFLTTAAANDDKKLGNHGFASTADTDDDVPFPLRLAP
jgi:hypothetical protein